MLLAKPDSIILTFDHAVVYSEELTLRNDCTFVVMHSCQPPLFREQETPEVRADLFGGIADKQDIVIALYSVKDKNLTLLGK